MPIRVEASVANLGSTRIAIKKRAGRIVRDKAEDVGRRMVEIANSNMADQFVLDRPFNRRRHPGSRRAATALDYRAEGSELPIEVTFRTVGGEEVRNRILGMNYGTGTGHWIPPSGIWELSGAARPRGISPRGARLNARYLIGDKLAWPDPLYKNGWRVIPSGQAVWHPGTPETGFLQEARDQAVREML